MQSTDSFVDEIYPLIYTKSVESILSLVPRHKGLRIALIVETSNANTTSNLMQQSKRQENARKYQYIQHIASI